MILSLKNKIDEGGYSVIIKDGNIVYKLFKNSINVKRLRSFEDKLRNLVFNSEVDAYHITQNVNELKQYVPEFYGTVNVEKVEDEKCNDVSNLYLLDCCYSMEYIEGQFYKLFPCNISDEIQRVINLFNNNGINYLIDSCISYVSDTNFKIIDFATCAAYSDNELKYI